MCAGLFIGSGAVFSYTVKHAFFSAWRGSQAVVVEVLIGICWALVLGQLLGAFGWLSRAPLLISAVGSAAGATLASRHFGGARRAVPGAANDREPVQEKHPALLVTTVVLVLFVAAIWTARTVITVRRGIYDPDSLGYHLPFTTTFAQTGYADQTRFMLPTAPIHFFPANDELLSAIALVLTRSVAFVAIKNLLYSGLILVAAHAIGKAFNAGLLAVSAMAIVLGLPAVAFSQAGEGMNDTLPVFALLGGLAILAHARNRPAAYVLALACTGVAYGAKYSTIIPAVAVGVLALWLLHKRVRTNRVRAAAAGTLASLAVGGSWYLRNALTYASPVPPARLGIGGLHLRHIVTEAARDSYSVAWYLVRGRELGQFWSSLSSGLSPLFLLVLGVVVLGSVAGLRSSGGFRRGLSLIGMISLVGYLTLPGSAYGTRGQPGPGFVTNLHYAMPALAISFVAAAIAVGHRRWTWVVPATGCVVAATSIRPGLRVRVWAPDMGGPGFAVLIALALAGGVVSLMSVRPSLLRWARAGVAGITVVAMVGVTLIFTEYPRRSETDSVQAWAAEVAPTRIGGWVPAALLYAPGVPNRVVTLTRDRSVDGGPIALDSCPAWMNALREGRFPYTAVVTSSVWQTWLDADPAFVLVAQNDATNFYRVSVYYVAGQPDPGCPRIR